jgi:IS30 family transposase
MAARLTMAEREEIALGRAAGQSLRSIARRLDRHPCTVLREVRPDEQYGQQYRATTADYRCYLRAKRPKRPKLVEGQPLRPIVLGLLTHRWSPQQIAARLRADYPDNPEMWVSHETVYQAIYLQTRGLLRLEVASDLIPPRSARLRRDSNV